jgi:hypothetical protein
MIVLSFLVWLISVKSLFGFYKASNCAGFFEDYFAVQKEIRLLVCLRHEQLVKLQ